MFRDPPLLLGTLQAQGLDTVFPPMQQSLVAQEADSVWGRWTERGRQRAPGLVRGKEMGHYLEGSGRLGYSVLDKF